TPTLLCEISRPGIGNREFDFISLGRVANYRFHFGTVEVKDGDVVKDTLQHARAIIVHDFSYPGRWSGLDVPGFATVIAYVGNRVDPWLELLATALPPTLAK